TCQSPQRMVDIPRTSLAHGLSSQFDRRRHRRMRRYSRQPAQLISAEAQHVVEAGIGAVELECAVQLALAAQHARRQLVGQAAIAFGQSLEVTITRVGEWCAGANFAENLEGRATRGGWAGSLNPASPWSEMTASRLRGAACSPPEKRRDPRSSPGASRAPSPPDPARP